MSQCEGANNKISTPTPAPPPNSPDTTPTRPTTPPPPPLSEKTKKILKMLDTVDEEDVLSREEKLNRVNTAPIPPGAKYIPGGVELDSDEEEDFEK